MKHSATIIAGSLVMAFSATAFAQSSTGGTLSGSSTPVQTEDLGNITPSPNPNMTPTNPATGARSRVGPAATPYPSSDPYPSGTTYPSSAPAGTASATPNGSSQGAASGMAGSGPGVPANQNGMGTSK